MTPPSWDPCCSSYWGAWVWAWGPQLGALRARPQASSSAALALPLQGAQAPGGSSSRSSSGARALQQGQALLRQGAQGRPAAAATLLVLRQAESARGMERWVG